jgi:hypothetical protein
MSKFFLNSQLITLLVFLSAVTLAMGQELPTSQDYMQSAQTALQDNDLPRAIQDYLLAIKLDSQNWQAYQNLGGCYVQLGKLNEAKAAYQQSLTINPNNPVLKQFMAQVGQVNPTPTSTVSLLIAAPSQTRPTPTATFVGVLMNTPPALPSVSCPQATATFIRVLMNTPTPMRTVLPTPVKTIVMVPFIEFTTPMVSRNGVVSTPVPYQGFKAYTFQGLPRYNLPDKDSLTIDVGGAAWFGSAQNTNDYFGPSLPTTAPSNTSGEADLGVDYAIRNEFQLGFHLEGLIAATIKTQLGTGEFVEWDSYSLGGALSGKYLVPLNSSMSLIFNLEGGYYTLIGTDITFNNGAFGDVGLGGSAFGGLGAVELELFQVEDKSIALDFGLGYRALTFNNLTASGTIKSLSGTVTTVSSPLTNANGTPAYVDFSGLRFSMSIRFVH